VLFILLFDYLGGFMNKDDILALLRKNPKLTEEKKLSNKHKIADAYLQHVSGGRIDSQFSEVYGPDGSFNRFFARGG
jgi:hypothetical protein